MKSFIGMGYFCIERIINLILEIMMTTNDVAQVLDTVLSIPGMNEVVKIDLRISRKNVLLLNHIIERGLSPGNEDKQTNIFSNVPEETLKELKDLGIDCLQKAGLVDLSEKLSKFNTTEKK
jgi:hypothetical protein